MAEIMRYEQVDISYNGCPVVQDIQTDISELILRYLETHDLVEIPSNHPLTVLK